MAQYVVARRKSHPVRNVLLVILVVVLAYLGCAGLSLYHIYDDTQTAQSQYSQLEEALSSGQLSGVLDDTKSLCSTVSDIDNEAQSWVWTIGEYIPWIGEDVTVGRGLASVSNDLCSNVVLPLVEQYEGITSGSTSVSSAADALSSAEATASSCSQQISSLGTSHFQQLNDAKDKLSQAVSVVSGSLGSISSVVSALSSLGSLVSLVG